MSFVIPGRNTWWRHYKGGIYQVLHVASCEDDGTFRVIYKALAGKDIYSRTVAAWSAVVSKQTGVKSIENPQNTLRFMPMTYKEAYEAWIKHKDMNIHTTPPLSVAIAASGDEESVYQELVDSFVEIEKRRGRPIDEI